MSLIGAFTKQPAEILPVDISYATVIGTRTATSITPVVQVPVGMTLASQDVSASVLQIYVQGGTTTNSYRWTVVTDIVIGGKTTRVEDEFDVVVEAV